MSSQELKKGLGKKEVKSKWAAMACVVLLYVANNKHVLTYAV